MQKTKPLGQVYQPVMWSAIRGYSRPGSHSDCSKQFGVQIEAGMCAARGRAGTIPNCGRNCGCTVVDCPLVV